MASLTGFTSWSHHRVISVAEVQRPWRDQMKASGQALTQAFARRLIAGGYQGLLVRSFARGATGDDLNLVLWKWGNAAPPA
jgi:hypothetical protein